MGEAITEFGEAVVAVPGGPSIRRALFSDRLLFVDQGVAEPSFAELSGVYAGFVTAPGRERQWVVAGEAGGRPFASPASVVAAEVKLLESGRRFTPRFAEMRG